MTTKLVEPILRYLLDAGEVQLDGFILPAMFHRSRRRSYQYLPKEYEISGVITGFEPAQLLSGIYKLIDLAYEQRTAMINDHPAIVTKKGKH